MRTLAESRETSDGRERRLARCHCRVDSDADIVGADRIRSERPGGGYCAIDEARPIGTRRNDTTFPRTSGPDRVVLEDGTGRPSPPLSGGNDPSRVRPHIQTVSKLIVGAYNRPARVERMVGPPPRRGDPAMDEKNMSEDAPQSPSRRAFIKGVIAAGSGVRIGVPLPVRHGQRPARDERRARSSV